MLQKLCNHHPDISITYELRSFVNTGRRFPAYYLRLRKKGKEPLNPANYDHRKSSDLLFFCLFNLLILRKGLQRITIADVHNALRVLFPRTALVGDKYPRYLWQLEELTKYAGIRIIIIYRDGRDVAQSIYARTQTDWKDKDWAQDHLNSFPKIAARWVEAIEIMEKYADKIHIIRYENIVTDPETELTRLAEYLGVNPAGFSSEVISSSSVGKYKEQLTVEQINQVEMVAASTLRRLGYL